ncbi:e3 ubiquitin-protein transferase maea [Anaeramoeba flamelloides]|uniref:E3 ubiquitin-protein transferase maea n=1 Tax=Anaeramoeba flamelloides TaxID=1746091 RepID=A0AAV8A2H7_9EUKA|nr:e3 ubiquitin-protein transferase maea [Anaeramoeba flamelloides]
MNLQKSLIQPCFEQLSRRLHKQYSLLNKTLTASFKILYSLPKNQNVGSDKIVEQMKKEIERLSKLQKDLNNYSKDDQLIIKKMQLRLQYHLSLLQVTQKNKTKNEEENENQEENKQEKDKDKEIKKENEIKEEKNMDKEKDKHIEIEKEKYMNIEENIDKEKKKENGNEKEKEKEKEQENEKDTKFFQDQIKLRKLELNRKLTEYMFRKGYNKTGTMLTERHQFLKQLVDQSLFLQGKKVSVSLSKHNLSIPLKWCLINRSKLKKIDSRFEFQLKKQQFIEIMRKGNRKEAINYARKNFPPWVGKCFSEIKSVMGLLAFPTPNEQSSIPNEEKEPFEILPERYQLLYGEHSWRKLNELFTREHVVLFGLSESPSIEVEFKAGICAVKTASCHSLHKKNQNNQQKITEHGTEKGKKMGKKKKNKKDSVLKGFDLFKEKKNINTNNNNDVVDRNTNCPTCHPIVNKIAKNYPRNLITHSLIICPLSGQIMTPDNPPMIFPNGNAYSLDEMKKMAEQNNGIVTDIKTNQKFKFTQLRKAFIV